MNFPGPSPAVAPRLAWCSVMLGFAFATQLAGQIDPGSAPRYPSDGGGNSTGYIQIRPVVICFPPNPPPLDRAISHVALQMPPRLTPPAELSAHVNEPYYAPLSTWLIERALTDKMRERITAHHAAKAAALVELRATLEQLGNAAPPARRGALEALARQQTPKLAALERDAEQIRADLVVGNYDWRSLREWTLGESNRRGDSPMEIAATMRAYAFYQTGLAAAQRRLLREISVELAMAGEDTAAATAAQPFLFFSPEPARVLLPDDLPADVAAKLADYQTKKSTLKKELYDAVYKQDKSPLTLLRNRALKSLADSQTARLAQLETLAEEIRRGLADLPSVLHPAAEKSALPPVLTERLNSAVLANATLQKETIKRIDAVRAGLMDETIRLSYSFDSSGLKFVVIPRPSRGYSAAESKAQLENLKPRIRAVEAKMTEIAEDYGRRYAELVNESNAIRADASVALANTNARAVDAALMSARRLALLKESEDAYQEYRLAVFEPGMSPEQRRLLFGGAIDKLDLPLLQGEYQPVKRAAGW